MKFPVYVPLITNAYTLYCNGITGELCKELPGSEYECVAGLNYMDGNGGLAIFTDSLKWTIGLDADGIEFASQFIPQWCKLRELMKNVESELAELSIYAPPPRYYPTSEFRLGRFVSRVPVSNSKIGRFMAPMSFVGNVEFRGLRHPEFVRTREYHQYKHLLIELANEESKENWSGFSPRIVLTKRNYEIALKDTWLSRYKVKSVACLKHGCYVELPTMINSINAVGHKYIGDSVLSLVCEYLPSYFEKHLKQNMAIQNRMNHPDSPYFSPLSVGVA